MAALRSQFQFTATFNQKVPRRVWFGVGARNWLDFSSEERSTKKRPGYCTVRCTHKHTNEFSGKERVWVSVVTGTRRHRYYTHKLILESGPGSGLHGCQYVSFGSFAAQTGHGHCKNLFSVALGASTFIEGLPRDQFSRLYSVKGRGGCRKKQK